MTGKDVSGESMSNASPEPEEDPDDLLPEHDFDYSKGKPNRFAASFPTVARTVTPHPDVAADFPDAESVNAVLRASITTMPRTAGRAFGRRDDFRRALGRRLLSGIGSAGPE